MLLFVSFSVSAESVFGELTGKYRMSIFGKDPARGIIVFEKMGRVIMTSEAGDALCHGHGDKEGAIVEIKLSCNGMETVMRLDVSDVADFERFVAPITRTIAAWGVQRSNRVSLERL